MNSKEELPLLTSIKSTILLCGRCCNDVHRGSFELYANYTRAGLHNKGGIRRWGIGNLHGCMEPRIFKHLSVISLGYALFQDLGGILETTRCRSSLVFYNRF